MSNCAKLLCAAVLFILATVTSSTQPDNYSAIQCISFVKGCIKKRASLLERLIKNTNSLPNDDNYTSLMNELEQNMTMDADWTRLMVHFMINDPKNTHTFDKTQCKRFLVDYEKEIEGVESRLNNKTSDALNKTIETLRNALIETNKALDQAIKPLESAARTCQGSSCNNLRYAAEATLHKVFQMTSKFVCTEKKQVSYMRIIVQMENDVFVQKGADVVKKTRECVFGNNSTHHGSVHV